MARPDLLAAQLSDAAGVFPGSTLVLLLDGTHIVHVPMDLPPGWNRQCTLARFVVPVPYPAAQLDCFYADADLRLANGDMPTNSGPQPINGESMLWFSWHLTRWDPTRDSLLTFIRFINERLRRAQ